MVLLGTFYSSAKGLCGGSARTGSKIEALTKLILGNLFFNLCSACKVRSMSAFPASAFSAKRIRETQRDMKISNTKKGEPMKYFNTSLTELSPLKYNSKLMNSIWGFYNRYSPHNVKKINDAFTFDAVDLQQKAANSTAKSDAVIALPSAKLDQVWIHSQSH